MNPMQQPRIEKITLNVGAGKEQSRLEKGVAILRMITGIEPMKTVTNKRIPTWGLRPGLPIGCKLTLRKNKAVEVLKRLLEAKNKKLQPSQFDETGNISFGIHEYIDIPGVTYDPKIGVLGLQVCITLEKPGYRIKRRKVEPKKLPRKHMVSKQEAMVFMQKNFGITIGEQS
ncbi:MAG: 50S ribosomal protein L5 [Candidatus Woesearchaeota archaeon]|nr:50S ribosomal protein L5 [Candidatus Woesearchaeota archaeon]